MTTTHTFQGLNTDNKPSSRVLNPPGGSSSNIFGGNDDRAQQKAPARNIQDKSEGQPPSQPTTTTTTAPAGSNPQSKARGNRSGDDSFHSIFGAYQTPNNHLNESANSPLSRADSPGSDCVRRRYSRSHHNNQDSFLNIFGESSTERRKMFRSVLNYEDSFSNIFGPCNTNEQKEPGAFDLAGSMSNIQGSSLTSCTSFSTHSCVGDSSYSSIASRPNRLDDVSSFRRRGPYQNVLYDTPPLRQRRFSDRGAFNPITGEAYDEPKQKSTPEPHHPPASVSAESIGNKTIVDTTASSEQLENTVPNEGAAAPEQAVSPVETAPAVTEPAQAKPPPSQQAQSGGMFGGGSSDAREHTSTRVSQPPGGRSTKLW